MSSQLRIAFRPDQVGIHTDVVAEAIGAAPGRQYSVTLANPRLVPGTLSLASELTATMELQDPYPTVVGQRMYGTLNGKKCTAGTLALIPTAAPFIGSVLDPPVGNQFAGNLSEDYIIPGTFIFTTDTARTVTDDGVGNLIGDVDILGANTINYATGAYDFTVTGPAPTTATGSFFASEIDADTITDDGAGNLIGAPLDPAGVNAIDYATGAYDLTLLGAYVATGYIYASYGAILTATDDGEGLIIGDIDPLGTNTVNYITGDVEWGVIGDAGVVNGVADYTYQAIGGPSVNVIEFQLGEVVRDAASMRFSCGLTTSNLLVLFLRDHEAKPVGDLLSALDHLPKDYDALVVGAFPYQFGTELPLPPYHFDRIVIAEATALDIPLDAYIIEITRTITRTNRTFDIYDAIGYAVNTAPIAPPLSL